MHAFHSRKKPPAHDFQKIDVLFVDAFNGDSIPVHLLPDKGSDLAANCLAEIWPVYLGPLATITYDSDATDLERLDSSCPPDPSEGSAFVRQQEFRHFADCIHNVLIASDNRNPRALSRRGSDGISYIHLFGEKTCAMRAAKLLIISSREISDTYGSNERIS